MGQALYRKYRSKSLKEIVGQEHITQVLANSLKAGKISHAYLLTGPRGVGKTSVARILAHEINGLAYDGHSLPIDIIEIDAASNRRIDEIRDLRDKVHVTPVSAAYKVYIIDEVHMLTKEAFNALLKTLEEPPAHVVFILATTEAHKLPETIISRTQRFSFKPIEPTMAATHLKQIAKDEGIKISDEALALIAEHGDGSFRDSIGLLDQASATSKQVEIDDIRTLLGIPPATAVKRLLSLLKGGTPQQLLTTLTDFQNQGYHAAVVAKQLGTLLREHYINQSLLFEPEVALRLMQQLLSVPTAADSETALELALLGVNLKLHPNATAAPAPKQPPTKTREKQESTPTPAPTTQPSSSPTAASTWQQILHITKQRHNTLYSVLRMGVPDFQTDKLIVQFGFGFHQKRLQEAKNHQLISEVIQQVVGRPLVLETIVVKGLEPPTDELPKSVVADTTVNTLNNIFGNIEVLES